MPFDQVMEQRRAVLDAVAVETRKIVAKIDDAGLDIGSEVVTIDVGDNEWHVDVAYNRESAFVRIEGHIRREEDAPAFPAAMMQMFGGGPQDGDGSFDFNCPVDWVPKGLA